MLIQCTVCKKQKKYDQFSWRNKAKELRHTRCKACQSEYTSTHYQANKSKYKKSSRKNTPVYRQRAKEFVLEYLKEHSCVDCGEPDPIVLDFDHVDRTTKEGHISQLVSQGNSLGRIKREIAKCEVRCANCHRRRTAKQLGYFKASNPASSTTGM